MDRPTGVIAVPISHQLIRFIERFLNACFLRGPDGGEEKINARYLQFIGNSENVDTGRRKCDGDCRCTLFKGKIQLARSCAIERLQVVSVVAIGKIFDQACEFDPIVGVKRGNGLRAGRLRLMRSTGTGEILSFASKYRTNACKHADSERFGRTVKRRYAKAARTMCSGGALVENALTVGQEDGDRVIAGLIAGPQKRSGIHGIAGENWRALRSPGAVHLPGNTAGRICRLLGSNSSGIESQQGEKNKGAPSANRCRAVGRKNEHAFLALLDALACRNQIAITNLRATALRFYSNPAPSQTHFYFVRRQAVGRMGKVDSLLLVDTH